MAAVLVVYAPTLGYPFVYEDRNDSEAFLRDYSAAETGAILMHRPTRALTFATFEINKALFGAQNPVGFHAGNVVLHMLCVLLVGLMVRQWCPPAALLAMGVFALHPLQTEAVAYVSSRAELLAACGVLLALWATSAGSVAGAWLGVVVAALGKETAVVAWGLVPLWAAWTRAPFPVRRWLWTAVLPLAVGAWVYAHIGHVPVAFDLAQITETSTSIWRMVGLFWLPVGFTIDHDWQGVPALWQSVALVATAGLTAWAISLGWARSWVALAWLWTVVALAPRFIVPAAEGLHEHHFYVPMIGWCLCAGGWLHETSAGRLEGTLSHGD